MWSYGQSDQGYRAAFGPPSLDGPAEAGDAARSIFRPGSRATAGTSARMEFKALYAIEDKIRGQDAQACRAVRQQNSKKIVEAPFRLLIA